MKPLILIISLFAVSYGQDTTYGKIGKIKLDTISLLTINKSNVIFSYPKFANRVDTNNVITIPKGWQWVVIMKDNGIVVCRFFKDI